MSAKFVWGVVAIVVGVWGIFSGIEQISDVVFIDEIVESFSRLFKMSSGKLANASYKAKLGGFIKICGGASLCLLGTWLIQEARHDDLIERRKLARQNFDDPLDEDDVMEFAPPTSTSRRKGKASAGFSLTSSDGDQTASGPNLQEEGETVDSELCQDCGAKMVVKKVSRGPHTNRAFHVCVQYPQCRNIIPISDEVAAQMDF